MMKRIGLGALLLGLWACGHAEQKVVDQYFGAVNSEDTQTLSSFAAVAFDKKVEKWSIVAAGEEQRIPAELPGLVKRVEEAEAALAKNKKDYNAYFLEHPKEVDQVRELLKKGAAIPGGLKKYGDDWKGFTEKEKELKKAVSDAKGAVEREKRYVTLSLGPMEDIETLTGERIEKKLDLQLTLAGAAKDYAMTLRKYELSGAQGTGRLISRWIVYSLEPRG